MVTETEGYIHIIEYLTEHLGLFENSSKAVAGSSTILETIEQELSDQIISMCSQNETLTFNQRNTIIREVDAVLYDLQEILSNSVNNPATNEQAEFLKEFALLIKNLFDAEIHAQFLSSAAES